MTTDVLGGRIEREIDLHKKEEKLKISDNDDSNDDDDEFSILPMAQLFEVYSIYPTAHNTTSYIQKARVPVVRTPQIILYFPQFVWWECKTIKFPQIAGISP